MLCCRAGCGQAEIYEKCAAPLVDKFLGGANACLLAYGQTASGKTYTSGTDGEPHLHTLCSMRAALERGLLGFAFLKSLCLVRSLFLRS